MRYTNVKVIGNKMSNRDFAKFCRTELKRYIVLAASVIGITFVMVTLNRRFCFRGSRMAELYGLIGMIAIMFIAACIGRLETDAETKMRQRSNFAYWCGNSEYGAAITKLLESNHATVKEVDTAAGTLLCTGRNGNEFQVRLRDCMRRQLQENTSGSGKGTFVLDLSGEKLAASIVDQTK